MRKQHVVAGAHQLAAVAGPGSQPLGIGCALPLVDEAGAILLEGHGQRAYCFLHCGVVPFADADGQRELACAVTESGDVLVAAWVGSALPRSNSPIIARLPLVAEPNSQSSS